MTEGTEGCKSNALKGPKYAPTKQNSNRFASPASPGGQRTCAELKLDELTVLMLAELNYFPGYDIIAERNDLPDSDIIEYRPYINALIFHIIYSNLEGITKGKLSERCADSIGDLLKTCPKSEQDRKAIRNFTEI